MVDGGGANNAATERENENEGTQSNKVEEAAPVGDDRRGQGFCFVVVFFPPSSSTSGAVVSNVQR